MHIDLDIRFCSWIVHYLFNKGICQVFRPQFGFRMYVNQYNIVQSKSMICCRRRRRRCCSEGHEQQQQQKNSKNFAIAHISFIGMSERCQTKG